MCNPGNTPFGDLDIPHIGHLYREIRESRRLSLVDVARWAGVDKSTLTRFETTGQAGSKRSRHFDRYVQALSQKWLTGTCNGNGSGGNGSPGKRVRKPLSEDDCALLEAAYKASRTRQILYQQEDSLAHLDFEHIKQADRLAHLAPLAQLLRELRAQTRPAFIADSLWFIHAINGACSNLFRIPAPPEPRSGDRSHYFYRWEAWHIMGAKFFRASPVYQAHESYNDYFPPTVDQFFRSCAPQLFTLQQRALVHRLMQESDHNDLDFTEWWLQAAAFNISYKKEYLHRQIKFEHPSIGKKILNAVGKQTVGRSVAITPDHTVDFWLGIWYGNTEESDQLIANLPEQNGAWGGRVTNQSVYFAADYDYNRSFHVNTWAEVAPLLAQRTLAPESVRG